MPAMDAVWRGEIDAVEFHVEGGYRFVVHRNVFRTLTGAPAVPEVCVAFVDAHAEAFLVAARARILEAASASTTAFHLNSRQVRRAMGGVPRYADPVTEPGRR